MWGADLAHLERLSRELHKAAERLEDEVSTPLSHTIDSVGWHGTDVDAFRYYWGSHGRTMLRQTAHALKQHNASTATPKNNRKPPAPTLPPRPP